MATVSIFNITNISTTRALTFTNASEREAWFDNYADTPFDIAEIKDINALQQQIPLTSENDEDVCKAVAWLGDEEIAVSSDACFFVHNLNPKYVAYFFQTEQFQKQKRIIRTQSFRWLFRLGRLDYR